VAQQSVTKIIALTILHLVTPKAGAEHELLFNKLDSGFTCDTGETDGEKTLVTDHLIIGDSTTHLQLNISLTALLA
jgi:hypothetical protein